VTDASLPLHLLQLRNKNCIVHFGYLPPCTTVTALPFSASASKYTPGPLCILTVATFLTVATQPITDYMLGWKWPLIDLTTQKPW
jgi:hypothetical protein